MIEKLLSWHDVITSVFVQNLRHHEYNIIGEVYYYAPQSEKSAVACTVCIRTSV